MILLVLCLTLGALLANASSLLPRQTNPPICTDGGQLHCCQATFSGGLAPIVAASDLACYDLTPAVVNCIITNAPMDPATGCEGVYTCCQVNDLAPLLGLFCSKPPGDCIGSEANGQCTDLIDGRFGNCSKATSTTSGAIWGYCSGALVTARILRVSVVDSINWLVC